MESPINIIPPFVTQKVEPKCAAVKRFWGRPRDCAKSDACGTFEAIKRSPIFYASSPRSPFFRKRSCRGFLLSRVYFAVLRTAQFAAAPTRRTATRARLVLSSAVGEQQKTHAICCIFQLDVLLLGQAIRRKGGFVNFAERKSGTFPYTPQSTSLVPTNAEPMFGVGGLNGFLRYGRGLHLCLLGMGLPEPSFDKRSLRSVAF